MKRIITTFLVIALIIISLTACEKKPDYDVYIWQSKGEMADALEELVDNYENETGKKVKVISNRASEDHMGPLRAEMNKRDMPTVYSIQGQRELEEWLGGGFVADLTDWSFADEVAFGKGGISRDGKLYGVPYNIEGYGFIYDEKMLTELGLTELDIKSLRDGSFEEFEEFVVSVDQWINGQDVSGKWAKINEAKKEGELENVDSVIGFPGKAAWVYGDHLVNIPFVYEFGTQDKALVAETIDFTYANQYKAILDLQINFSKEGFSNDLLQNDYDEQAKIKFGGGEVFFIQQGNWAYGEINDVNPDKAMRLSFIPLKVPTTAGDVTIPENHPDSMPVFAPNYWAVNGKVSSDLQEEAKAFIEWMYTSDIGKDFVVNKFNFIPAVKGFESSDLSSMYSLGLSVMDYVEREKALDGVFMAMPGGWSMNELGNVLQGSYITSGKQEDFEAAIDHSIQKWEELRK
ncbi:MAG: ABC transporter substrate-binding protein [Tissierellaceae bacterium]